MKNRNFFPKLLFVLVVTAIAIGLLLGIFLPWIIKILLNGRLEPDYYPGLVALLYVTYVPFMVIWAAVFKLCRNLANDIPFCKNSILNLKIIGVCAFFDCLVFIAGVFLFPDGHIVFSILAIAALMIGMISAIIRELVIRGIELREEVDLTV